MLAPTGAIGAIRVEMDSNRFCVSPIIEISANLFLHSRAELYELKSCIAPVGAAIGRPIVGQLTHEN